MKNLAIRRVATLAAGSLMCSGLLAIQTQSASAYQTDGLMIYLDASNTTSYNGGTAWNDLSGNNRDGTLMGPVVYDATTESLQFPGGANGTAYVNLAGEFSDFSSGITVEFEGEFGSARSPWERIFDFGIPGGEGQADDLWVGHFADTNELAIETWHNGVNQGRCHTSASGGALGTLESRALAKWMITIDNSVCRIYKNGIEIPTQVANATLTDNTPVEANGSAYPLPLISNRTTNYLGRSNWTNDSDLEGSIRYIRLYNRSLTAEEALENSNNSELPSDVNLADSQELANTGSDLNVFWAAVGAIGLGSIALTLSDRRSRRPRHW